MTRLFLAVPALLAMLAGAAPAQTPRSFANDPMILIDHGVICQVAAEGARPAPDTMVGEINLVRQTREMDVTTRVVPAKPGISFGIKFTLRPDTPPRDMNVIVTHPAMGPEGVTRESWTASVSGGRPSLNLFTFEFPYELVTGAWTMALEFEGERLMEQHFEVVPELAGAAVLSVCYGQDFVS
ncbi:MAG: DUF3859 domain-containing protein [Rhodobacteraceae bacterium]|uniref:DUF3859 domain-containing protein n=1 Tax=Salipiger profundus TaxID=1229727 RepID=A0A1U7D5J3_9RHOB|nr:MULTISPECIES: DUF3859 domain-containing protein [Salipiger]APX23447.1 protein of unknown function (DUF3859) [Salipiger profundus]MAB07937.1 DUF3859 domain-containing protein [Paracoccaceae bacterium]GGA20319.1 hypothetical protein GCM10011326_36150 [Salipiger profundus]SFC88545.1 protein of unknown function [Salipiger profundus]